MRSLSLIVIALVVFSAILLPQLLFSVDETEVAIVTRFGQIKSEIYDAGLNVKTPFMDSVTKFDKRLLIFDSPPNSLLTKDKKRLIIDVYARGRIVDSGTFRERLGDEQRASDRAVDIISSELRREVASHNQSEIITTQRDLIMANVLKAVTPKLADFGIEVDDVRIKRADFPSEIAESVYARMQAERKRKADKERAEGAEIDAQVRADADRKATIILANARRDSSITRGCGEAEATGVFAAALNQDPEFYSFQRSLESFRRILGSGTTVVLPLGGFGGLFEQIREGIDDATLISPDASLVESTEADTPVSSKCAEVAAAWYLASDLNVDQPDLTLVSLESKQWTDPNFGCVEGAIKSQDTIDGFLVNFLHLGEAYSVRTNLYGSVLKIC